MTTTMRQPGFITQRTAEATIADGVVCIVGSADYSAAVCSTDPVAGIIGIAKVDGAASVASGGTVDIVTSGVYPGIAMDTITQGQPVTVGNTAGGLKAAAPAGGANAMVVGIAQNDAASGERVAVQIGIYLMQGA